MSQAARLHEIELDFELCTSDGVPVDSERHGRQMHLFASVTETALRERGKDDFYVGTDMFVYYDVAQARAIAEDPKTKEHFKGPDIFFVGGVSGHQRDCWVVWEEGNRYPDVVVELLSPATGHHDKTGKKEFYAKTFRTPEYFYYRPGTDELAGFRLKTGGYEPIRARSGRLWSRKLSLSLGVWEGPYEGRDGKWLRLFERDGRLILTPEEAQRQRAEAAEAEVERLRALLARR